MKNNLAQLSRDYQRIEAAILFLEKNFQRQPSLQEIAQTLGMSEYHFQKIFQRWAGISPKRFLQFLTKEHAKELLKKSSLLNTSYDAGLSGSSRLHDLFVNCEAMTPGEYKQKGKGLTIHYGFHPTPFGECFIALTDRGICSLLFIEKADRKKILNNFKKDWQNAALKQNQEKTKITIEKVFFRNGSKPISVLFKGTNFQIKVWEALLMIPSGAVVTYKVLAERIGDPQAARAVGNAVGKNTIAYLIPCHRVIRGMGDFGGYRWGVSRKRAMLGREVAQAKKSG